MPSLKEAKQRLDRLIAKSRAHLYKPIGIAETLYRNRVDQTVDLANIEHYRRRSYDWCRQLCSVLYGREPVLNSRYWDQLFDPAVIPPGMLVKLGDENRQNGGLVESYIYAYLLDKFSGIIEIVDALRATTPRKFQLSAFLGRFERDARFRRSVDKVYEIVVYALFNGITKHLRATVTLSVDSKARDLLRDFEDFAKLVLGVDSEHPQVTQPARLYRVGTANAADAGLDMWANFGPAVQVKHLSLSPSQVGDICGGIQADKIVIVCKSIEAASLKAVLEQVGLGNRIRGIITEKELTKWYQLGCGEKYHKTLGADLVQAILDEVALEFPITQAQRVKAFFEERGYDASRLTGLWAMQEAIVDAVVASGVDAVVASDE